MDADKLTLIYNTPVGPRPRYAAFDRDGKRLWVTSEVGGTLHVIDAATHAEIKTVTFSIPGVPRDKIQPVGIRLTDDGRTAFVALGPANHVAVIDAKTLEVRKYLLVGRRVWQMAFTPDRSLLLTTNGVSGDVSVIDVAKLEVIKSIPVGRYPWGVAIRP
jgi:PQQ-dependent catabolism-associated beta-propeller protein